jgi:ABC-type uncharacterized transport system substrate-binding protein
VPRKCVHGSRLHNPQCSSRVSLARPGGNATGVNFFNEEITSKRLGLLRELLPSASRIAVLTNPNGPSETQLQHLQEAGRTLGLQFFNGRPAEIRKQITRNNADATRP